MKYLTQLSQKKTFFILLGASLILLCLQIIIFRSSEFPLTGDDNIVHYTYIKEIIESRTINMQRFYPFGMHVIVAGINLLTGFAIEKIIITLTFIIVSLVPLGFYYLTKILTEKEDTALLVAAVTPLIYIIPLRIYSWGGYPFLWGLTILWFYIGFTIDAFKRGSLLRTFLALVLGWVFFIIHSPDLVTANIFILCFALVYFRQVFTKLPVYLFGVGNLLILGLVYFLLKTQTAYEVGVFNLSFDHDSLFEGIAYLWKYEFGYYVVIAWMLMIFTFLGLRVLIKKIKIPSGEAVIGVYLLVMCLFFIDIVFLQKLHLLYKLVFPWGERSRFFEFFTFPLAFVTAHGIQSFYLWWQKVENLIVKNMILYIVLVFTLTPPLINSFYFQPIVGLMSPPQKIRSVGTYATSNLDDTKIILNDIVWGYMAGEEVYRSADFSSWLEAITTFKVAFPYDHQPGKESFDKRYYVLQNLSKLGEDEQVTRYIEEEKIGYVYWEEKTWWEREHEYLKIEELLTNKNLELMYTSEPVCREDFTTSGCIFIFEIQNL